MRRFDVPLKEHAWSHQTELKEIGLDLLNKEDEVILDDTGGGAEEEDDSETKDISNSVEVTWHEEDGVEGCPEL
eukprot:7932887-Ditylum_brightwellii.AAC.1